MLPTLSDGDWVLAKVRHYRRHRPQPGEVVVVKHPFLQQTLVKRVCTVTQSHITVIGDNQKASTDSRAFGPIPISALIGQVSSRVSNSKPERLE